MIDWYEIVDNYNEKNDTTFPNKIQLLTHLYKKTNSLLKAADIINVSHYTIWKELHNSGIKMSKGKATKDEIIKAYNKLGKTELVAEKFGYHPGALRNKIKFDFKLQMKQFRKKHIT